MSDRLIPGAALPVEALATHRDWLFEKDRDVELQSFHTASVLNGDWKPLAEEARRQLDGWKGRLGVHGPFWGFTIDSEDPEVREIVTKRMLQGLDVCAAVGADQMVIHSPYTTWDYNNLDNNIDARKRLIERTANTLRAVISRAESQGVTLVIENIQDINPMDRRILAQALGSDRVRLSIDTGHAQYAHVSTGAPPVDYFVGAAGDWLEHVHLQDAEGYADRHWAIGEGTIRWHAVFRALAALKQKPRLVFELRDHAGIPASIAYLIKEGLAQ
jgi:sugar phosphate isomerase/epimerase